MLNLYRGNINTARKPTPDVAAPASDAAPLRVSNDVVVYRQNVEGRKGRTYRAWVRYNERTGQRTHHITKEEAFRNVC